MHALITESTGYYAELRCGAMPCPSDACLPAHGLFSYTVGSLGSRDDLELDTGSSPLIVPLEL